jgi:hypothetical protein
MNTRQKILQLFKEGKTPEEIIELLKDEKVSSIRSYVSRVKRDFKSPDFKGKERVAKRLRKAGIIIKGKNNVACKCVTCGEEYGIRTSNRDLYDLEVVKENWTCAKCTYKLKRVLITLKCVKCGKEFKTKVLEKNKNKYKSFECEKCNV